MTYFSKHKNSASSGEGTLVHAGSQYVQPEGNSKFVHTGADMFNVLTCSV